MFLQLCRYSLLPALTVNGIIYSHIKEGAYNGDQFMAWLEGLLEVMNPYPASNSVLILDNCRIHHVEGVEELCAQR
jgi:transposase